MVSIRFSAVAILLTAFVVSSSGRTPNGASAAPRADAPKPATPARSAEWVKDRLKEVDAKLEKAMVRAYREVADFTRQSKVDRRIAAYAIALSRIEAVYKEREIFP